MGTPRFELGSQGLFLPERDRPRLSSLPYGSALQKTGALYSNQVILRPHGHLQEPPSDLKNYLSNQTKTKGKVYKPTQTRKLRYPDDKYSDTL